MRSGDTSIGSGRRFEWGEKIFRGGTCVSRAQVKESDVIEGGEGRHRDGDAGVE